MPKVHVIGSVNVDFVIQTKSLPRAGETLGEGVFQTFCGGKGANQALAAQRLGAQVSFSACVGDDVYADVALENLHKDGVDLSGVRRRAGVATGAAFINVDESGENQIAVAPGANNLLCADEICLDGIDIIIAQLETPAQVTWQAIKDSKTLFCLNAAPAKAVASELLQRADLLVVNEVEKAFYENDLYSFKGLIAETYGSKGAALYRAGKKVAEVSPPKVEVIDTTGAGDCFTGALATAIAEGQSDTDALRFASLAGAHAVTALGAQNGIPYRQEIQS